MKTLYKVIIILLISHSANSQTPTFILELRDFVNFQNGNQDSVIQFSIYLRHSNAGSSDPFNYATGQYFIDYPAIMLNGGAPTLTKIGSDLPLLLQSPVVSAANSRISCAANIPVNLGFIIPSTIPGIKVLTLKFSTSATTMNIFEIVNMHWRTALPGPFTKIAYYDPSNQPIEIPNTNNVFIDPEYWPVEISSFTSAVNKNNVLLQWTTTKEINNTGFDIERKLTGSIEWTKIGNIEGWGNSNEDRRYEFSDRPASGYYNYRLKQLDFNGNFEYFSLNNEVVVGIPSEYQLSQNYPNPFNPMTAIDYDVPTDGKVSIELYDASGRKVADLLDVFKAAGYYTMTFNGSNFASGIYFYRISAAGVNGNFSQTKKMMLIK